MKPTVNVSIAGIAFMLDTEAYKLLKDYTIKIEVGYKDNPDGAEILSDIEARIVELILSQQTAEEVVTPSLIQEIIDQLGLPDDLKNSTEPTNPVAEPVPAETISRRLYRDPENAKLGGVCSGLAAYFATEPVWVRLIFVAPLLLLPISGILFSHASRFLGVMFAVSFMLYFILWFAIPKAKTPLQKLEMKGRKITASSLHRTLQEEINTMAPSPKSERTSSFFAEFLYVLGRIILFFIKALAIFIGGVLIFAIIMTLIATTATATWLFADPIVVNAPFISGISTGALVILMGLGAILPMVLISILLLQFVFKTRPMKKTMSILLGIWVIILIFLSVITVKNLDRVEEGIRRVEIESWFDRAAGRRYYNNRSNRPAKQLFRNSTDTTTVEQITLGDSIVTDTIRREYFTE